MLRKLSFVIAFLLLLSPCYSHAEQVTIGIDGNPPLTFFNGRGEADGLFPELFRQVASRHDWTLSYVSCEWQQCLEKLATGEIDILPAIAYTEERAQHYRFAGETVLNSWGQIYHRTDGKLDNILDLEGLKLAALNHDVYLDGDQGLRQIAEQFGVHITYIEVASYQEAFEKLAEGGVDAAMVGRVYGIRNRERYDLLPTSIMIKPIQVRPAFSPLAANHLITDFDRQLSAWKKDPDSVYYTLLDKWLGAEHPGTVPDWLRLLMYSLSGIFCLLIVATLWTRKQVKIKTLQLAEKNLLLEKELEDRRNIERELLERQQQYKVFFEESHSAMLLLDPESGEIVDANPAACRYYGYSREQLQEMKIWRLNQLSKEEVQEKIIAAKNRQQQQFEFVHRMASGLKNPVEVHSSPIQVEGRTLLCSIVHDISKRKQAEQALEERNYFLQSVIDGVSDPLMVIGMDYQVLQMNQAARALSASAEAEQTCYQLTHASQIPCQDDDHPCPLHDVQETGRPVTMIHNHETDQGKRIVELTASPLFDNSGKIYAIIEVARDITERLQVEELLNENEKRLHHLAHHDSLTDLPNRLLFEDRLNQALSKARRSRRQVALCFLDLDNFKAVNDNLGHDHGDLLLIDVAKRLRSCVRESDTVARMGGDEFLVLLEDIDSIAMIEATAERIVNALTHQLVKGDYTQMISASIGISIYPEDSGDGKELMKRADIAMYRAKKQGRANYQFYSTPQGRFVFD